MGKFESELVILKLGGSLITHKDKPLSPNSNAIMTAARAISHTIKNRLKTRLVVIHGGGSFGHYYGSKFGLSTRLKKVPAIGASKTAGAMISLHSIVLSELLDQGVPCKTILTSEFLSSNGTKVTPDGSKTLSVLFGSNFVPITFGNISITERGVSIISGDQIALSLVRKFRASRVVFAMDVDGIYPSSEMKGDILSELHSRALSYGKERKFDITGGIKAKIDYGFRMAALGANVFYVNGLHEDRLKALISLDGTAKSTKIYAHPPRR